MFVCVLSALVNGVLAPTRVKTLSNYQQCCEFEIETIRFERMVGKRSLYIYIYHINNNEYINTPRLHEAVNHWIIQQYWLQYAYILAPPLQYATLITEVHMHRG